MCTSNSGLPFNQPSKSSTKWALVMYRPGDGGGGETPLPPPPPQYSRHAMRAEGLGEKSVSTGTTAITGVAGGCSGSSSRRLPCTSNATGTSWSAIAVATSTLAPPVQARRWAGTGRDISSGMAASASRARSLAGRPVPRASAPSATPPSAARKRWNGRLCSPDRSLLCSFPILMPSLASLFLLLLARDTTGYWQQQVSYRITASLDEPTGALSGRERISYVNRSSATLRDFYVHQYLNAFRPGSRWAAVDAAEDRDRFQHLGEPDYAFERITGATLGGREVRPDYPYAPDSTIAHWALARPLVPGASLVVEVEWQARLSTLPRRQGRRGRRFDVAQRYAQGVADRESVA